MNKNVFYVLAGASLSTFVIFWLLSNGDAETAFTITAIVAGFSFVYTLITVSGGVNILMKQMQAEEVFEGELVQMVHGLADKAEIKRPRVAVVREDINNACALGALTDSVIVFYQGLLNNLTNEEIEAVTAHEIGHIQSGDSLTKQGMFASIKGISYAILAPFYVGSFALIFLIGPGLFMLINKIGSKIAHYVFGFIGTLILSAFSRQREYAADQAAAELTSPGAIISALDKLKQLTLVGNEDPYLNSIGFAAKLSATHPSIDDRIRTLEKIK